MNKKKVPQSRFVRDLRAGGGCLSSVALAAGITDVGDGQAPVRRAASADFSLVAFVLYIVYLLHITARGALEDAGRSAGPLGYFDHEFPGVFVFVTHFDVSRHATEPVPPQRIKELMYRRVSSDTATCAKTQTPPAEPAEFCDD